MPILTSFRTLLAASNKGATTIDIWTATVLTGIHGAAITTIAHRDTGGTAITQGTGADQPTIDLNTEADLVQANFADTDHLVVAYSGNVRAIGFIVDIANSETRPLASRDASSNNGFVLELIDDPA